MLDEAPNFRWVDYSAPRGKPAVDSITPARDAALRRALTNRIRPTHCVLVLAGMYAAYREWMQAEIEIAQEFGKPIIAVVRRGGERVPTEVQAAADERVHWNTRSIVGAIRRRSL
ncbi:MAG: TIR domain-containing protein [Chloroflexota bacterium]|nr:TIR domain-containing protein [Chloroflexota bacterium]